LQALIEAGIEVGKKSAVNIWIIKSAGKRVVAPPPVEFTATYGNGSSIADSGAAR
jgi:hypothetical protein